MASGFREGYEFFQKNAGALRASFQGGEYVESVKTEITKLEKGINSFFGDNTSAKQLKGDIAEFWHSGTFNVDAAVKGSAHRTFVDRSHELGSADISSSFGESFGLKYYATGAQSAKQQAKSVFERYMEYKSNNGTDDFAKYLADRHYTSENVLNDPLYQGQIRIIPTDQLEAAKSWLREKIAGEAAGRPEQVKRYQDTLDLLTDHVSDSDGNKSITLTKEGAEKLATLAKKGKFKAEDYGVSVQELVTSEMVVKESLKAGLSAAVISFVLKLGPEIFKSIDYLIKNGEIDGEHFKKVGFAAVTGFSEGFIRGTVAAGITLCCKSGKLGEALKNVDPGIVGTIVAVTMNTMKNAFQVAIGKKSRTELANDLIRDMFVSSSSLALGYVGQIVLHQLPVVGYMVGSFVGSVVGSFAYNVGYKAVLSFCTETGVTLFGLVEQDYKLPEDVLEEIGLETFDFDSFSADTFEPESFSYDTFDAETIQPDTLGIKMLRRGVIGVLRIGYVV